ncbi:hypothetical protein E1J03_15380 [Phocaeicola dorei]|nr:hypothetical protein E1J03_15380 [Phocaeicola dorei]
MIRKRRNITPSSPLSINSSGRIGNNYNQCVKTIHTIYGDKKSLAFLYKLAEETRKLEEVCRQVIELTKRYEKEYLTKKE